MSDTIAAVGAADAQVATAAGRLAAAQSDRPSPDTPLGKADEQKAEIAAATAALAAAESAAVAARDSAGVQPPPPEAVPSPHHIVDTVA